MPKLDTEIRFDYNSWPYLHSSMVENRLDTFYGPDSQTLFDRNLKYMPNDWLYRNKSVSYKFNNVGLRSSKDFTNLKKQLLFSGTSFTFGIGLAIEDRFSDLVSNESGIGYINYSGPTYTIKLQILSFFNYLKKYEKPYTFVIEYPPVDAYTFFLDNKAIFCYYNHMPDSIKYKLFVDAYNSLNGTDFFYHEANFYRNQLIVMCEKLGIKLIELSFKPKEQFVIDNHIFAYDVEKDVKTNDINLKYARDIFMQNDAYSGHPGIKVHRDIAEIILKRF